MKNKDLIITIARRLDKFNLNEMIVVSELDEKEVQDILSNLISEQIIIQNNNMYYFNNKKTAEVCNKNNIPLTNEVKPIIIEEEDGYDYFLTLSEYAQNKVRNYVELINLVRQTGSKNIKSVVEFFNETTAFKKVSYTSFSRLYRTFNKYGFKGILPNYSHHIESSIPEELYTYFKKYYLTKEKLSFSEAIYRAQMQLQQEQKIEQPFAHSPNTFNRKLKAEFSDEQIEYFRNNINPHKVKNIELKDTEPLDMQFKKAARVYLSRLKAENQLEKLMHEKTDYNNHLKEYFDDLTIREITPKAIAKYKQEKFDNGFQLASVNTYIGLLKKIIKSVCPETNSLITRKPKKPTSFYALDMNILSDDKITELLNLCHKKYPSAYPVLYISLSTGASIPELLGLTWNKINFKDNTIFLKYFLYGDRLIMNRCASTIRILKIDNKISEVLQKKYKEIKPAPDDFVFTFDSLQQPQQYFENVVLSDLVQELGIPKLYPSDLQHNYTNMCIKQNIPLTYIQKSLGYYGIVNFVKTYRNLIEKTEVGDYNPLENIKPF